MLSEIDVEEFNCSICLDILNNPTVTQCCRQTFCYNCINDWIRIKNVCPFDYKPLTIRSLLPAPRILNNLLSDLKSGKMQQARQISKDKIDKLEALLKSKQPQKSITTDFKTIEQCHPINLVDHGDFQWLFRVPFEKHLPPKPNPEIGPINTWDLFHVKMPNSTQNNDQIKKMVEVKDPDAGDFDFSWQIVEKSLSDEIKSIADFEDRVKNYNRKLRRDKTEFNVLHNLDHTFDIRPPLLVTLNFIRRLTLRLPEFFPKAIPFLNQFKNSTLVISRQQIACLLANAFFCTFPRRAVISPVYKTFSTFNFASLFSGVEETVHVKVEKLKCIINYFNQINPHFKTMNGVISFERRLLTDTNRPNWQNSEKKLRKLKVELTGTIEKEGKGFSQVDFAAKFIGANVLHSRCYREEIWFLTHPELIVSRLFTEALENDESLIVTGCFQCNQCTGYDKEFKWSGDYAESLTLDDWGRAHRQFVLIDAYYFQHKERQYNMEMIDRELNKAFSGFYDLNEYEQKEKPAIASGKWGSGMCNGDSYLKLLIQLLAASEADRNLILYTFNDNYTKTEIEKFYSLVNEKQLTVGQIYTTMKNNPFPNSESKFDFNYLSFISTKILT